MIAPTQRGIAEEATVAERRRFPRSQPPLGNPPD